MHVCPHCHLAFCDLNCPGCVHQGDGVKELGIAANAAAGVLHLANEIEGFGQGDPLTDAIRGVLGDSVDVFESDLGAAISDVISGL